jgi:hypothetical protein
MFRSVDEVLFLPAMQLAVSTSGNAAKRSDPEITY